jgi:hypothetical protein
MIRKALLTTAAAVFMLALSSVARADTLVIGNSTGGLATATVDCTFNDATNTFTFTVTNTSPFDARVTGIGFDLVAGDFDAQGPPSAGLNGFAGADVAGFEFTDAALGNVAQFNSAVLDFGFTTGNSGNFNGGSPDDGLAPGQSLTFTVTGAGFGDGLTAEELCAAIFVRFQRVGADGEGSDVGRPGGPNNPVPEPMTMLLFGTGLAGVAARVRRSRNNGKA